MLHLTCLVGAYALVSWKSWKDHLALKGKYGLHVLFSHGTYVFFSFHHYLLFFQFSSLLIIVYSSESKPIDEASLETRVRA